MVRALWVPLKPIDGTTNIIAFLVTTIAGAPEFATAGENIYYIPGRALLQRFDSTLIA